MIVWVNLFKISIYPEMSTEFGSLNRSDDVLIASAMS